ESGAARSGPGARDADHADRVHRVLRAVPVRARAVLAHEHGAVDPAAVADQHDRRARGGGADLSAPGAAEEPPSVQDRRGTTIAAVATPPGVGAVAIVRLSGPRALEIARAIA